MGRGKENWDVEQETVEPASYHDVDAHEREESTHEDIHDYGFGEGNGMSTEDLMRSDDEERDRKARDKAASANMGARAGDGIRTDRPNYGALDAKTHGNIYEGVRAKKANAGSLPGWHEMDDASRAAWQNSSEGRKAISSYTATLPKTMAGEVVNVSPDAARPEEAVAKRDRPIKAAIEQRAFPTPAHKQVFDKLGVLIEPKLAGHPSTGKWSNSAEISVKGANYPEASRSPIASAPTAEHHEAMESLIKGITKQHGENVGGMKSTDPLAETSRNALESLAVSAKANTLGHTDDAVKHFTNAVGHTMRAASIAQGAANNAGVKTDIANDTIRAAGQHLSDYKAAVGR
jgi:hypothetical protein